jgi:AraC-like DNA-binding protein
MVGIPLAARTGTPHFMPETPNPASAAPSHGEDLLADVLGKLHLSSAVFLCGEFSAPWAFRSSDATRLCRMVQPDAARLILFHVALEGSFFVQLKSGECATVQAGDAVVFPYCDDHEMGDPAGASPVSLLSLLPSAPWTGIPSIRHGGSGPVTRMLCGYLQCDELLFNPLLQALPRMIHSRPSSPAASQWREASLRYCVDETGRPDNRANRWLSRLPEMLLVDCLRQYADGLPRNQPGWLGAMKDPVVGRALMLLHAQPGAEWNVPKLARAVAVSRSVLGERFASVLQVSPMRYLAQWRMQLAANMLRDQPELTLAAVAGRVGYEGEAAFSRAFKRQLGVAPATWRKTGGGVRRLPVASRQPRRDADAQVRQ